jgi:hypothetical protein
MEVNGTVWAFSTSSLSDGTHEITFEVQDDGELWSEPVSETLIIGQGQNIPPVAFIDSISPNPADSGESVTFVGHGTDSDGTVVAN